MQVVGWVFFFLNLFSSVIAGLGNRKGTSQDEMFSVPTRFVQLLLLCVIPNVKLGILQRDSRMLMASPWNTSFHTEGAG